MTCWVLGELLGGFKCVFGVFKWRHTCHQIFFSAKAAYELEAALLSFFLGHGLLKDCLLRF